MNFRGIYADLTGQSIQKFTVEGLAGRDPSGAPRWKVVCSCGHPQVLGHAKLLPLVQGRTTQTSLLCGSPACPLSRRESQSETIEEFRRQERREAEQAARLAAESQKATEAEAAKRQAEDARIAALKAEYRFYWNHQIKTEIEESKIIPLTRWCELSEGTRKVVLDALSIDPNVRISGL
jgi:hypothetical protein